MCKIFNFIFKFLIGIGVLIYLNQCGIGLGPEEPGPGTTSAPPPFIPDGITRILLDLENKYWVSGYTNSDQDFTIGKFFSDGSLDTSFAGSGTEVFNLFGTDHHHDSTIDLENRFLVAGVGPLNTEHVVARLTSNGFLDSSFSSDGKFSAVLEGVGSAKSVAVQSDGKYIISGTANKGLGTGYGASLARLHTNGTLDTTFSFNGSLLFAHMRNNSFNKVTVDSNGKYVVAGMDGGRLLLKQITRWDGIQFNPLNSGLSATVRGFLIASNGIYVAGDFANAGGITEADGIARWDGSTWHAVDTGLNALVSALGIASNGIYVGGQFVDAGGIAGGDRIARWDGSTWHALGTGHNASFINSLVITTAGVYVGGGFNNFAGVGANRIALWNGSTWSGVGGGLDGTNPVFAVASNGIYVGGSFGNAGGIAEADRIARWDGSTWHALGTGLLSSVAALAIASDGLYVGGNFSDKILKWNGSTWNTLPTLSTSAGVSVSALAIGSNGVYVGGNFSTAGGIAEADGIALWNGSTWSAVSTAPLNNSVLAFALATDGIYVGGTFTNAVPTPIQQSLVARFLTSGLLDVTFFSTGYHYFSATTDANFLNHVAIEPTGNIITVGYTSTDFLIARFRTNGLLDTTFNTDGISLIDLAGIEIANQIIPHTNGKYLIAGSRNTDGVIARILSNGVLDTTFATNGYRTFDYGSNDSIGALVLHSDSSIAIGLSGGNDLGVLKISP